jgi:succinyl-diaminopimelate desuccinylase
VSATVELACELIRRVSVTPDDGGCQALIAERLARLGFAIEKLRFGAVDNLWAVLGSGRPRFVFAGHTDVVPPGPRRDWSADPFTPTLRDGRLYGRGAADMKGSIAAMVTATERLLAPRPALRGSFAFLLTSDEEGPAIDGTARVVELLQTRGERIDWCLVGEPSSASRVGDRIRNGRRGSFSARLRVIGEQGHVANPHNAVNPVHMLAPALAELCQRRWDEGNAHYPPTGFQVSNIAAGTGADNVIPGDLTMLFNFRYCTESTTSGLQSQVEEILRRHGVDHEIEWTVSGEPFLTPGGRLLRTVRAAIEALTGLDPECSTGGGTSDGRFIAPTGAEVIELGPVNESIHKVDEWVSAAELDVLSGIYQRILERMLTEPVSD